MMNKQNNLLNKNLKFLKKQNINLYNFISKNSNNTVFNISQNKKNEFYFFYLKQNKKIYLTSKINPKKESERKINFFLKEKKEFKNIILFELLTGYETFLLNKLTNQKINVYITIYSKELFKLSLSTIDLEKIFHLKNINLFFLYGNNDSDMFSLLKKNIKTNHTIFFLRKQLLDLYKETLPKYEKSLNYFSVFNINDNFEAKTKNIIDKNININIDFIKKSHLIADLKNTIDNSKTALLVGAGPSIDFHIDNISNQRNKYIIFSTDTSLPILMKNNILPDFVISIDPQDLSYDYFKKYLNTNFNLIFTPYTNYNIIKNCKCKKYLMIPTKHFALKNYNFSNDKFNFIEGGGSVSCYILDLIIKFNFKNIDIVGQDFKFKNKLKYSKDSLFFENLLNSINKFKTIESDFYLEILNKKGIVENNNFTLLNLKSYNLEFKSKLSKLKNKNICFLK